MTDRNQIEGSKERAANRGQEPGFVGLSDGSLARPDIVQNLVREFLGKVIDVRTSYNAGTLPADEAPGKIKIIADDYAAIFLGESEDYEALPWNAVEYLGLHLSTLLKGEETPEEAPCAYFLYLASTLIDTIVVPYEDDQIGEEMVNFRIDALVDDAVNAFLGDPISDGEISDD
jgi:hypothetical protein